MNTGRLLLLWITCCGPVQARHCELNGVEVNPDNGATTAGQSGILRCHRDDGSLWYEKELHDGEHLGLDRWYDTDGSKRERTVNARGNTDGRARQWWPGGPLQQDGEYRNAQPIGLHRSWHRNGQLQALHYYEPDSRSAALSMQWDDAGRLQALRCAARSLIEADRDLCAHGGQGWTELHDGQGGVQERRLLQDGRLLASEHLDRGQLTARVEYSAEGRVETRFHPDGEIAQRDTIEGGYRVLREQWFMNGALKARIRVEPKERDARRITESFRDDGTLAERIEEIGQRRLVRQRFDEQGILSEDWEHAEEGHVARHRRYAPDGRVLLDERFYPDGSRRATAAEAKISQ